MEEKNIITLKSDDDEIEVEVIEQTIIDGVTYLLVANKNEKDENSECYILKDVSSIDDLEAKYEVLFENEEAVLNVFEKLLKKDDIVIER